jgi:tripartite-type tricarboxylate transporter receptor subunit TctC
LRRRLAGLACGLLATAAFLGCPETPGAWAADGPAYPAKPIRLVVGFPPGSAADLLARLFAAALGENLGQAVLVDNKPGAGSAIAAEAVVNAAPDGYTLLLLNVANAINASLSPDRHINLLRDLQPVAGIAEVPNLLVVQPKLGVGSVGELIALAKAQPGLLYGSSGNGTSPHLSAELFQMMAGIRMVHVPYKGSPQAVTDLIAGRVQLAFAPVSSVLPHIRSGSVKALAISGASRASLLPDLPTVAESGLPGFETTVWFGLAAPAGLPPERLTVLEEAAARISSQPHFAAQLAQQAGSAMPFNAAGFSRFIEREVRKWAAVVKASGAAAD